MIDPKDIVTLGVKDFQQAVAIVDVAASRGAFKGEELMSVGTTRERFNSFVKQQTASLEKTELEISSKKKKSPTKSAGKEE
jgi:hypothetical protein